MATNSILPWAQTGSANVLSDTDYAADVASGGAFVDGVTTGQASSKQANKTWRQATAPAAGLGQFLTDNLSVDVTDADTPATFSTRIANAVLKLAQISNFNAAWANAAGGYKKYAVVSDSSGNFWVSTADANTTVPGTNGANWQSLFNGYLTESQSDGRYVQQGITSNNDRPAKYLWLDLTTESGYPRLGVADTVGTAYGFYGIAKVNALIGSCLANNNPGISGALAGTSLCVNPADGLPYLAYAGNSKIVSLARDGDKLNVSGGQVSWLRVSQNLWVFGNQCAVYNGVSNAWVNTYVDGSGNATWDLNGGSPDNNTGNKNWFRLHPDGSLYTGKGTVAFEGDFVASGLFDGSQGSTTSGTIVGGTWMRVGNTLTQNLVIKNIGGGTVTFPFEFSGNDDQVTVFVQDGTGSNNTYTTGSITTTGTGIHAAGGGGTGRLHLTASGPYGT